MINNSKCNFLRGFIALFCLCTFTSCTSDDCSGSNAKIDPIGIVIAFVDSRSGENLLESNTIPIPNESIQVIHQTLFDTTNYEGFSVRSFPQFEDLGTLLFLDYTPHSGRTDFIISVLQYPSDTISVVYSKNEFSFYFSDSLFHTNKLCTTQTTPSIIISK